MPAARALRLVRIRNKIKGWSIHEPMNRRYMILRLRTYFWIKPMAEIPTCKHEHTRLIAKDNEAEYVECVNCGAILETHELAEDPKAANPESTPAEPAKSNSFDESLSDA